jgi:acetoacetyl-CoA reductase/3-oxoacyl-[acyl-carrier protein] reductase
MVCRAQIGITIDTIAPGYTNWVVFSSVPAPIQQQIGPWIPQARFGQGKEIAKAVIFPVADGDDITGEQMNIDGGAFEAKAHSGGRRRRLPPGR